MTTLIPSSKKIKSMLTVPVTYVACDIEYAKSNLDQKYHVIEFALWDIFKDKKIFETLVRPKNDINLHSWRVEHGYSREDISNAITMDELDAHLKYLLPSFILVFWYKDGDLRRYPQLQTYALGVSCAMERYSKTYGPYDPNFGDRRNVRLVTAAQDTGFVLEANEFFHTALIDAKACAHVWRYCEKMDLPSDSIELDLVLRRDVEQLLNTLAQKDESEENKVEVPLPF